MPKLFPMAEKMNTLTVCRASAGTGKTYTLASRYIALLMDSDGDFLYRNILAVTFTNKATAEMKQRILSYLYLIAEGGEDNAERKGFLANMVRYMRRGVDSKNRDELRHKARRVCHYILEDYDNMKVVTIDSFLQTLIAGIAQAVGIGASFNVVLDINHVISTAIDEIMTTHIDDNTFTKPLLTRYVEEQFEDEKGWDVRSKLLAMAKEIFQETVQKEDHERILDVEVLGRYQREMARVYYAEVAKMQPVYNKVCNCRRDNEIDGGAYYYDMITRVKKTLDKSASESDVFRGLSDRSFNSLVSDKFLKKVASSDPERPREVQSALEAMHLLCGELREKYLVYKITNEYLNDLMLMTSVKNRMNVNLKEANSILLASTAYVLSQSLKPGDADFILEKAGIRFRHIMIDEFQDTSTLQWQVFSHLVSEVLGSGGTTLIVGDVKQSIYRWRNGDYTIMENLNASTPLLGAFYDENSEMLTRNFRSQANVVEFNLSLFDRLTRLDDSLAQLRNLYQEGETGYTKEHLDDFHKYGTTHNGYVQYRVYPYAPGRVRKELSDAQQSARYQLVTQQIASQMFEDIRALLDRGARPADILILIRNKSEIGTIVEAFDDTELPRRGVALSSNDSFLLERSVSVMLIVSALKYVFCSDSISGEYLTSHGKDVDRLMLCDKRMPLYELVEKIVNILFADVDNEVHADDMNYIDCFMDNLRSYVNNYGSDAKAFVVYWDDELHKTAIPATGNDGIRIMTIHTSKGLDAKHLFVPFCSWKLSTEADNRKTKLWVTPQADVGGDSNVAVPYKIPVTFRSALKEVAYEQAYSAEKKAQLVDNLNLLYVALTRAADNLFVYSPISFRSLTEYSPNTVGDLVFECLSGEEVEPGVTLGEQVRHEWDNCEEGSPAFGQYSIGAEPFVRLRDVSHKADAATQPSPFEYSYSDDDMLKFRYYSAHGSISFKQSQESMLYHPGEAGGKTASYIDAGVLRHNILSEIRTKADADKVVDRYYAKGTIETKEEALEIKRELDDAWRKWPEMADWFGGGWKLLREVTLLCPSGHGESGKQNALMRPDRVMIKGRKAVVLDFKFGKHNNYKYSEQVKDYVQALRLMGYADVEGYLWYGFDNELVRVS